MVFWILFTLVVVYPILLGAIVCRVRFRDGTEDAAFVGTIGAMVGVIFWLFPLIGVYETWTDHASDVSRVTAQEHRIDVQQERIDSLSERLDTFNYPEKSDISLDRDYPWAAIIESLSDAEDKLAEAKDERAVAIRSIEARKRGPMSGVVTLVGEN